MGLDTGPTLEQLNNMYNVDQYRPLMNIVDCCRMEAVPKFWIHGVRCSTYSPRIKSQPYTLNSKNAVAGDTHIDPFGTLSRTLRRRPMRCAERGASSRCERSTSAIRSDSRSTKCLRILTPS